MISSNGNSTAQKFKYNGVELEESFGLNLYEMDFRMYDPAIGRFNGIYPVTHYSQGTSVAFDNNPVFWADPSGANSTAEWMKENGITEDDLITIYQAPSDNNESTDGDNNKPDDVITVDSEGNITNVKKQAGDHVVIDQSGNKLNLNDNGFDQDQLDYLLSLYKNYGEAKIFSKISNKDMNEMLKEIDINSIVSNYKTTKFLSWIGVQLAEEMYLFNLGHGAFDFAGDMSHIARQNGLTNEGGFITDGTGGFFRFGNSNVLYNVYDAGNFMTGRSFRALGMSLKRILKGADLNSRITFDGADTQADQRAITNGYNYK